MNDDRQKVRDASDIVDVVAEVVHLTPKGREFVGICPFHDDHKPSMCVVPHKQIYHCFSCQAGGDVFTFVQEFHKIGFREALELLAERAGIELTRQNVPQRAPGEPTKRTIADANDFANRFFRSVLTHAEHGREARDVIEQRGIAPEMVERFQLGASPDRWDGLVLKLRSAKMSESDFLAGGLLKTRDSGGSYDALRNRLIFPIHDQTGRVVAFGGRKIDPEDEPKYLNSPETVLFNKSETLYGLHQALPAIKREQCAVVVEGYTDVIACHQAGLENVVGTLGTALTPGHARALRRLCHTIVLLFDGDEAGQRAATRGMDRLLDELVEDILFRTEGAGALDIKFANLADLGDAKDPDELLKTEGGTEQLRRLIADAPDLLRFRYETLRRTMAGEGAAAQERALAAEIDRLAQLGIARLPQSRKITVARLLAGAAGLDVNTVLDMLPAGRDGGARPPSRSVEPKPAPADARLGPREQALACLLADGTLWNELSDGERDLFSTDSYTAPVCRLVADAVLLLACDGEAPSLSGVHGALDDHADDPDAPLDAETVGAAKRLASRLHLHALRAAGDDRDTLRRLLADCLWAIEKQRAEQQIQDEPDLARQLQMRRSLREREQERKTRLLSRA
ncbi:MAG: DNA primase [Phycisphaerales bacterium JB040]